MFLVVPVTLMGMEERTKSDVGDLVRARRLELGLTPGDVVGLSGVDPKTYASLEDGSRWPQERTRLQIEPVLQWQAGSIERLRMGGDPIPKGAPQSPDAPVGDDDPDRDDPAFNAEMLKQLSVVALATTYNSNYSAPVQARMTEMLRVLRGNIHTVRQILLRDDDASVRGNAIEALNPADAAVTFLQQDLKTIESVATSSDEPPYTPSDSRYPSLAQFLRQQIEEGRNAVPGNSSTQSDASSEDNKDEEVKGSSDDLKPRKPWGNLQPAREDRGQDADENT